MTQQTATVQITNNMGGYASILLFHNNTSNGTQTGLWPATAGATVGPMTVYFQTGIVPSPILDYWSVLVHVVDGPNEGYYVSTTTTPTVFPYWKECQLQLGDAGRTITLSVSTTTFTIPLPSGGCTGGMTKIAPYAPVTHVFVVMLENRSFDHIFAMSGIPGITKATTSNSNSYGGTTYNVQSSAPLSMTTDPGHEFLDVVEQLAGAGALFPQGGPYPPIDMSGFAANYATSKTEGTGTPAPGHIGDIMACFATPTQLPVINALANQFAVCDHWYSSLPGPTWPNRFFVHGASSSGLDDSPTTMQMVKWETVSGFTYPNGSIYMALDKAGIPYRFYSDYVPNVDLSLYSDDSQNGSVFGAVAQVSALSGVTMTDIWSLEDLASDLQGPYPYPYTFIEPHYGDIGTGTYAGGSSQHPMDDVYGGENLLYNVYEAIRSSPYFDRSLLIVTYDEHGGFYDSVVPPTAPPPNDIPQYHYSLHGFGFQQYGVRVPAVVVSPLIPAGTVDDQVYDHASVLATLERLWGLEPLTNRDRQANDLLHLLSVAPRTDIPPLPRPAPPQFARKPPLTASERALIDAQPAPQTGIFAGTLHNAMKAELDLSSRTPAEVAAIKARFDAIQTRGDARAYVESVMDKVRIARRQRDLAKRPVSARRTAVEGRESGDAPRS